jgi:hypothetical protein
LEWQRGDSTLGLRFLSDHPRNTSRRRRREVPVCRGPSRPRGDGHAPTTIVAVEPDDLLLVYRCVMNDPTRKRVWKAIAAVVPPRLGDPYDQGVRNPPARRRDPRRSRVRAPRRRPLTPTVERLSRNPRRDRPPVRPHQARIMTAYLYPPSRRRRPAWPNECSRSYRRVPPRPVVCERDRCRAAERGRDAASSNDGPREGATRRAQRSGTTDPTYRPAPWPSPIRRSLDAD